MPIEKIMERISGNLERFEYGLERFGRQLSVLAKTSVKQEITALKRIEKDLAVIRLLKNDIAHKRRYADADIEGMNHLLGEVAKRERKLAADKKAFFTGNPLIRSAVGFEQDILEDAGRAARELHGLSTAIQLQIGHLLEFAEKELSHDPKTMQKIDKAGLHRKSLMLADTNVKLLQGMIYLSSLSMDSSTDLENYHYEKLKVLNDAKKIVDLDEPAFKDSLKGIASCYSSDLARSSMA